MVSNNIFIRYFSNIGFYSWLLQRISAIVIAIVFLTIYLFILFNSFCGFEFFYSVFLYNYGLYIKIMLLFIYFNILLHTWIGMWIIFTDYVVNVFLRFLLQLFINFSFFLSFLLFLSNL